MNPVFANQWRWLAAFTAASIVCQVTALPSASSKVFAMIEGQFNNGVGRNDRSQSGVFLRHQPDPPGLLARGHVLIRKVACDQAQQTWRSQSWLVGGGPKNRLEHDRTATVAGIDRRIDEEVCRTSIVPILYSGKDAMPDDHVILRYSGDAQWETQDEDFVALVAFAGSEFVAGDAMVSKRENGLWR